MTSIKTGLKIHKSKKHYVIEQLGGNSSDTEWAYAEFSWEKDYMGPSYQIHLDVMQIIKIVGSPNDEKFNKTERSLETRKEAL